MTGEDKAHIGGIKQGLERLPRLLIILMVRSRRIDGMVGVRDEPAIPALDEGRAQPQLVFWRLEVAVDLLLLAVE
ncbi:MAG TPA: hypothetical protein VK390_10960 [Propionibacteriaceae bacterium]|nr:hypothetical protein [Propionibacteriaceae bacterium]